MSHRYLEVDLVIIPAESGGRLRPIYPSGSYRPHLIVSNDLEHEMLGVKFLDGLGVLHGGERGQVFMECVYFDPEDKQNTPNYDKLIVGYQVRIVESFHIIAVGKILRVWDE